MSALFVLVPLGVVFALVAVAFFAVGVHRGQFDGLDEIGKRLPDDF
jgi:cbb3-type cytochrome oxidase maturation protein